MIARKCLDSVDSLSLSPALSEPFLYSYLLIVVFYPLWLFKDSVLLISLVDLNPPYTVYQVLGPQACITMTGFSSAVVS